MRKCVYNLTVRGYELDSFGHVNNAVYLQYAEAALWNFFKINQLTEYTLDRGIFPVLMECSQRYIHELKLLDEVRIESEFTAKGEMMIYKHNIINNTTGLISCKIMIIAFNFRHIGEAYWAISLHISVLGVRVGSSLSITNFKRASITFKSYC